ncbi:MAG: AAA family ATPase [Thermoplasmatota archaeon]
MTDFDDLSAEDFGELSTEEKEEFLLNKITEENIKNAIEEGVVKKRGEEENSERESDSHKMIYDNEEFSPKYVITKTYEFVYGEELSPNDFTTIYADKILEEKGFTIEKDENEGEADNVNNEGLEGGNNMSKQNLEDEVADEYKELVEKGRVEFITFHPSYSYEEFIEGITVNSESQGTSDLDYMIKDGIFKRICARALACALDDALDKDECWQEYGNPDKSGNEALDAKKGDKNWNTIYDKYEECLEEYTESYIEEYEDLDREKRREKIEEDLEDEDDDKLKAVHDIYWNKICDNKSKRFLLIIDEINRGDISKIFGELITLIEDDKRLAADEEKIARLTYSSQEFAVPPNVYLLGTMNTADRSIALLDVALRRRFSFKEMYPDEKAFNKLRRKFKVEKGDDSLLSKSIDKLEQINKEIKNNPRLGRDKMIGQSYFYQIDGKEDEEGIERVWFHEIFPLLEEYCWGDEDQLKDIVGFDSETPNIFDQDNFRLYRSEERLRKWLEVEE